MYLYNSCGFKRKVKPFLTTLSNLHSANAIRTVIKELVSILYLLVKLRKSNRYSLPK